MKELLSNFSLDQNQLLILVRKDQVNQGRSHPEMHLTVDHKEFDLTSLGKFDAILIDLPLPEYRERVLPHKDFKLDPKIENKLEPWSFDWIKNLPIKELAETQSFIFMWVGSGDYIDKGRDLLKHWGFRQWEDIVWIKTSPKESSNFLDPIDSQYIQTNDEIIYDDPNRIFKREKEHWLMGIKGTVRRSVDTHLIHTNIDTDVIIGNLLTNNILDSQK